LNGLPYPPGDMAVSGILLLLVSCDLVAFVGGCLEALPLAVRVLERPAKEYRPVLLSRLCV